MSSITDFGITTTGFCGTTFLTMVSDLLTRTVSTFDFNKESAFIESITNVSLFILSFTSLNMVVSFNNKSISITESAERAMIESCAIEYPFKSEAKE